MFLIVIGLFYWNNVYDENPKVSTFTVKKVVRRVKSVKLD